MNLYFVRHGQTDWNARHLTQGWTDIPLNETGIQQAKTLHDKLAQSGLSFDAVFSSPLKRAQRTAEIATAGNYEIIFDDRLKERNCGEFEGKPSGSIFDNCDIDFFDPVLNSSAFGVEPINDMTNRVRDFLNDLQTKYSKDANILIFTSNGVMLRAHIIITGDSTRDHLPKYANSEIYSYKI